MTPSIAKQGQYLYVIMNIGNLQVFPENIIWYDNVEQRVSLPTNIKLGSLDHGSCRDIGLVISS